MSEAINYMPNPRFDCRSPLPCPDACDTEAVRLCRQTQCLPCIAQPTDATNVDPPIINLLSGLAAYWKMGEPGGAGPVYSRYDSVDGHTLFTSYSISQVSGKIGFASLFDGDYLHNEDLIFISGNQPLSISAWVYMQSSALDQTIVGSSLPSVGFGWRVYYQASTNRFAFAIGNGATELTAVSSTSVSLGTWYHVVGVLTFANIKVYVNKLVSTLATGVWPADTSPSFRVGSDLDDNVFTGRIDEVGFWSNRALSSADVAFLYNGGAGITYPF